MSNLNAPSTPRLKAISSCATFVYAWSGLMVRSAVPSPSVSEMTPSPTFSATGVIVTVWVNSVVVLIETAPKPPSSSKSALVTSKTMSVSVEDCASGVSDKLLKLEVSVIVIIDVGVPSPTCVVVPSL